MLDVPPGFVMVRRQRIRIIPQPADLDSCRRDVTPQLMGRLVANRVKAKGARNDEVFLPVIDENGKEADSVQEDQGGDPVESPCLQVLKDRVDQVGNDQGGENRRKGVGEIIAQHEQGNEAECQGDGDLARLERAGEKGAEIEPGFERAGFEHRLIEIARLIGGELQVRSTPAEGSTFTLYVPLDIEPKAGIIGSTTARFENSGAQIPTALPTGFEVNDDHITALVGLNPMIATVLNPIIGYEKAAEVVTRASEEKKSIQQVAVELGYLSAEEAGKILDPRGMAGPGVSGKAR